MESFWTPINEAVLRQGDLLPGCSIPEFPPDFAVAEKAALVVQVDQADLIVITQSCDLEHGGLSLVAMCPVWSIPAFEAAQAAFGRSSSTKAWRNYWNNVRKGRSSSLHLLSSPTNPTDARSALVVDFSRNLQPSRRLFGPSRRASRRPLAIAFAVPGAFLTSVRSLFHARGVAFVHTRILTAALVGC